jgi:putative Mn2+ efflux pump MntP
MDILSIIIIGIGLAMDCFAVSISKGICVQKFQFGNTLKMAFMFGLFQALMPLLIETAKQSMAKPIPMIIIERMSIY